MKFSFYASIYILDRGRLSILSQYEHKKVDISVNTKNDRTNTKFVSEKIGNRSRAQGLKRNPEEGRAKM